MVIHESCNYEDKDELLEQATSNSAYPLRHAAIQEIIDKAPKSSIYQNPFSGFDNPDKERHPQSGSLKTWSQLGA